VQPSIELPVEFGSVSNCLVARRNGYASLQYARRGADTRNLSIPAPPARLPEFAHSAVPEESNKAEFGG